MLIFNNLGFVIFLFSFGVSIAIEPLLGHPGDAVLTMLGGALCTALDLGYRLVRKFALFSPRGGGWLLYLPLWLLGLFWLLLGALRTKFPI